VDVVWPDAPRRLCPCAGDPIDVDYADEDIQRVFATVADFSGVNLVVQPGTQGTATLQARRMPWDAVLERVLEPNGFVALREGNLIWIGPPDQAGPRRVFQGAPIDFAVRGVDLEVALAQIAEHGRCRVELAPGIQGRVTLTLQHVPWDQAFDVLCLVNNLAWERSGDVIRVRARRVPPPA
jgi:type II secretory pathway component HofQ